MNPRKRNITSKPDLARGFLGVFAYSRRALELVWTTSRGLSFAFGLLTILAGALPAAIAYVGSLIVDAVIAAINAAPQARDAATSDALAFVVVEGALVVGRAGERLGHRRDAQVLPLQAPGPGRFWRRATTSWCLMVWRRFLPE